MANITTYTVKTYCLDKVLDDSYTTTSDNFDIPSELYIIGAGVFIIAEQASWEAVVVSNSIVTVYFSKERLEQFGNGNWPFEIRVIYSNGHTVTIALGTLRIAPYENYFSCNN